MRLIVRLPWHADPSSPVMIRERALDIFGVGVHHNIPHLDAAGMSCQRRLGPLCVEGQPILPPLAFRGVVKW